jgi:hypothetical protein
MAFRDISLLGGDGDNAVPAGGHGCDTFVGGKGRDQPVRRHRASSVRSANLTARSLPLCGAWAWLAPHRTPEL